MKVVRRTGDSGRQTPAKEDDSGESNDTWAGISGGGGNEGKAGREPAEKRPTLRLGLVSLAEPAEELSDRPAEKRMYRRHRLPRHRPCPSSPRG